MKSEWDYKRAERHKAVKQPGAVVSVRMQADEFQAICKAAAAQGLTLSAFMRKAALTATHTNRFRISGEDTYTAVVCPVTFRVTQES